MNKTELIAAIADQAELSKKDSEKALKAFIDVVTEELKKEHVYVIALAKGIRVAACGIPKFQMTGLATKIYNVMKRLGKL